LIRAAEKSGGKSLRAAAGGPAQLELGHTRGLHLSL